VFRLVLFLDQCSFDTTHVKAGEAYDLVFEPSEVDHCGAFKLLLLGLIPDVFIQVALAATETARVVF
jgi:hypothetical protein